MMSEGVSASVPSGGSADIFKTVFYLRWITWFTVAVTRHCRFTVRTYDSYVRYVVTKKIDEVRQRHDFSSQLYHNIISAVPPLPYLLSS